MKSAQVRESLGDESLVSYMVIEGCVGYTSRYIGPYRGHGKEMETTILSQLLGQRSHEMLYGPYVHRADGIQQLRLTLGFQVHE